MSRPDEVIFLIGQTKIKEDDHGNQIPVPAERMVFAEELAVFSSEFYNAAVSGLRPEKLFEIYTGEYQGEKELKHNGITYNIIRTSLGKTKEKTRLTCERAIGDG